VGLEITDIHFFASADVNNVIIIDRSQSADKNMTGV